MGSVVVEDGGRRITLSAQSLIGRHPSCHIKLDDRLVSGEHASLHWTDQGWELRELGSRNGTFVDGKQLHPAERVALEQGARIGLGRAEASLVLADASEPVALARHVGSGEVRRMAAGLLALPDEDDPRVVLREDGSGGWLLEMGQELRAANDQQLLVVAGDGWRLELPSIIDETLLKDQQAPALTDIELLFEVSLDEEHVVLSYRHQGKRQVIPSRAFHYMLLTLARLRLADAGLPAAERGWTVREQLCKMLGYDQYKLNVEIHRARRQLADHGIRGAVHLIERRAPAAQLRIGSDNVSVTRL